MSCGQNLLFLGLRSRNFNKSNKINFLDKTFFYMSWYFWNIWVADELPRGFSVFIKSARKWPKKLRVPLIKCIFLPQEVKISQNVKK